MTQQTQGITTRRPSYEERQRCAWWVYIVAMCATVIPLIAAGMAYRQDFAEQPYAFLALMVGGPLLALLLMNLLGMTVRVYPDTMLIRWGWAFPMFWTRIPLSAIDSVQAVTYRPLLQAGGWGIRFGRFRGRLCRFRTTRGNQGVLVITANKQYIIGSQHPEDLAEALQNQLAQGAHEATENQKGSSFQQNVPLAHNHQTGNSA